MSLSSHKLQGPGGIGALFVAADMHGELQPLMFGGGQECGLRPGSITPFLAVGFGTAAKLAKRELSSRRYHLERLSGEFAHTLAARGTNFEWIGHREKRLPGHLSLRFPGIDAETLLAKIGPHISASSGSACAAGELRTSHVLRGLGMDEFMASEVIRLSFGYDMSIEQARWAAECLALARSE